MLPCIFRFLAQLGQLRDLSILGDDLGIVLTPIIPFNDKMFIPVKTRNPLDVPITSSFFGIIKPSNVLSGNCFNLNYYS